MISLTRKKDNDGIKWAFDTHVKKPDDPAFNYAELSGNEDCPDYINFWYSASPCYGDSPDYVWMSDHWDQSDDEGLSDWPPLFEDEDEDEDCPF